eukprot:scaffold7257_cov125-Isochrysis_galbana.AAC.1
MWTGQRWTVHQCDTGGGAAGGCRVASRGKPCWCVQGPRVPRIPPPSAEFDARARGVTECTA